MATKQLNVRIDGELYRKLDGLNGTKRENVEKAINLLLDSYTSDSKVSEYVSFLQNQIKELNRLLDQQQKLNFQTQQQLEDYRTEEQKKKTSPYGRGLLAGGKGKVTNHSLIRKIKIHGYN